MKVGVITFSDSKDNYGQLLQTFSMQRYLAAKGHDPFLIRYDARVNCFPFNREGGNKLLKYARRLPYYVRQYFIQKQKRRMKSLYGQIVDYDRRDFEGFRRKYLVATPEFDFDGLRADPPHADAYICGSDQIWYPSNDDAYFLSFVPEGRLKIAYAPSFGGFKVLPESARDRIKGLLESFDALGMRESSGVDVCRELGFRKAMKVPDPTLLLPREGYSELVSAGRIAVVPKRRYALVYLIGHAVKKSFKDVERYVASKGLELVYVGTQGRADMDRTENPTPQEWLALIDSASLVVTNSFHCLVFALMFHKNFVALPMAGSDARNNDRLEDILRESGLENRLVVKGFPKTDLSDEDFRKFDDYRVSRLQVAEDFLSVLDQPAG